MGIGDHALFDVFWYFSGLKKYFHLFLKRLAQLNNCTYL